MYYDKKLITFKILLIQNSHDPSTKNILFIQTGGMQIIPIWFTVFQYFTKNVIIRQRIRNEWTLLLGQHG